MIERAAELLRRSRRAVAFTGAGVSAESGIRTFRGEGGLWRQYDPEKVSSIAYFREDPSAYWTVSRERWQTYRQARPNPGHYALAELEAAGHLAGVVTQNTDGLHADAGTRNLVQLHGNGREVVCLDCGNREPRAEVQARLEAQMPPRCLLCGGSHMKPDVVLFGEPMPLREVTLAFELAAACDLMLVAGSSLVVYPAADVPLAAVQSGAPLVIVNAEPTPFDGLAEVVIRGRSGEVLPELARLARA